MARQYQDTETRRRQIAGAALRTIVEDGVHGFTTRAIASRVGITDGTLFRHFRNKAEIVQAALDLLTEQIDASMVSTGPPAAALEHFFRHRAAFVGSEGSVGRLIFSEGLMHLSGEPGRARVRDWRRRSVEFLRHQLRPLHVQGTLAPGLDEGAAAVLIQGVLLTLAMSAAVGAPSTPGLSERIDDAWSTLTTVLFP